MPVETTELNQKAVLWAASGRDDYGEPTVATAVEIDVRWGHLKRESPGDNDETIVADCTVYVDRSIAVGSILWLGRLTSLPDSPSDLRQVVDYNEVPDLKARNYRRWVLARKYKGTLPSYT